MVDAFLTYHCIVNQEEAEQHYEETSTSEDVTINSKSDISSYFNSELDEEEEPVPYTSPPRSALVLFTLLMSMFL